MPEQSIPLTFPEQFIAPSAEIPISPILTESVTQPSLIEPVMQSNLINDANEIPCSGQCKHNYILYPPGSLELRKECGDGYYYCGGICKNRMAVSTCLPSCSPDCACIVDKACGGGNVAKYCQNYSWEDWVRECPNFNV